MKTPEEMAEEYIRAFRGDKVALGGKIGLSACRLSYLAGYKAAQPKWISVQERLPEINEWVLINGPEICKRINPPSSNWKGSYAWETDLEGFYSPHDVTHWMPLPTPPESNE